MSNKNQEAMGRILSKVIEDYLEAYKTFGDAVDEMETAVIYRHDERELKLRFIVSSADEEDE